MDARRCKQLAQICETSTLFGLHTMLSGRPVSREFIFQLCRQVLWAPMGVMIVHGVAGQMFGHEPYVDPIMHFSGGLAAAFFFSRACLIAPELFGKPSRLGIDLLGSD